MAALLNILLVGLLCQFAFAEEDAEFAKYKEEHPEEFGDNVEGDMIVQDDFSFRNGIINKRMLWPGGVVPYEIDSNSRYNSNEMSAINAAISDFQRYTCIKWVRRSNQQSFVKIHRGQGCSSVVGMYSKGGRAQMLSLGNNCAQKSTVIHEMLHAIGFVHEQCRTDRDQHITVAWNNIQQNMRYNFDKHGSDYISLLGTAYDYGSVMHYGRKAFSMNGRDTMIPKRQGAQIGQRVGFSKLDIERVNKLYSCQGGGGGGVVPTQPPITSCTDGHQNCRYWQSTGECFKNPRYMLSVCKKSCRQC